MRRLTWLLVLLLAAPAHADMIVRRKPMFPSGCTLTSISSAVTLWWNGEAGCASPPCDAADGYTLAHGTLEYSAGDTTATFGDSGFAITNDTSLGGNYLFDWDYTASASLIRRVHLDIATGNGDIITLNKGRCGFLIIQDDESQSASAPKIAGTRQTAASNITFRFAGTDDLDFAYYDGSTTTTCSPNSASNVVDTGEKVFAEFAWDMTTASADYLTGIIDGNEGSPYCSTTGHTITPPTFGSGATFSLGNPLTDSADASDHRIKVFVCVNDPTIDLFSAVCNDSTACNTGQAGLYCKP